jgi:thioesterase domain-containing protein
VEQRIDPAARAVALPPRVVTRLTNIWQKVLERTSVGPEQNFFELGGDPRTAIEMFDQIRGEFGRTIPPLAIYTAPTIHSLAHLIADDRPTRFSNALLLRSGSSRSPVFLLHGVGGNVMEFFEVVKSMDSPQAIYGLQARGSDGLESPLDSIEAMAEYHIDAMRRVGSPGPYVVFGYSLGGLIALEIARRFKESEQPVALLSMIDSYPHISALAATQKLQLYAQRVRHKLRHIAAIGAQHSERSRVQSEKICGPAVLEVTRSSLQALRKYRPRPLGEKVRFVRAQTLTVFPQDPMEIWKALLPQIEVETLPGDHHEILHANSRELALALSGYIRDALG